MNQSLIKHISTSKLSLSHIAFKTGISKGFLSQINSGKKKANLETGLRILSVLKKSNPEKSSWTKSYLKENYENYESIDFLDDDSIEDYEKVNQTLSALISKDLTLLNIFMDILKSNKEGISKKQLKEYYGLKGLSKLEVFVKEDMLELKNDIYFTGKRKFILTKESSYDLIKNVINSDKNQYLSNAPSWNSDFQFTIENISSEGNKELQKLFKKTFQEAHQIMQKNISTKKESKRVLFQLLRTTLSIATIFFLCIESPNLPAGIVGGSSSGEGQTNALLNPLNVDSIIIKEYSLGALKSEYLELKKDLKLYPHKYFNQYHNWNNCKSISPLGDTSTKKYFNTETKNKYYKMEVQYKVNGCSELNPY